MERVVCTCELRPGAVARARRLAAEALRAQALDDHVAAIELAVSELAANVLRHGGAPAEMRLSVSAEQIRLDVTSGPGLADALATGDLDPDARADGGLDPGGDLDTGAGRDLAVRGGRGWLLWFVEEVADDWGIDGRPGRICAWMIRRRSDGPLPRGASLTSG